MAEVKNIIGVFDYRLSEQDSFKEFLAFSKWNSQVIKLTGQTKSVVVADGKTYLTPISRAALLRRWQRIGF